MAGCLLPSPPYAYDDSSIWVEDGLFAQLAALGAPPEGYTNEREAPEATLFPDGAWGPWDGAQPVTVAQGTLLLHAGAGGDHAVIASHDESGGPSRETFLAFARQVVASEEGLEDLADTFMASSGIPHNPHAVMVTQPLSFAKVAATLGDAPASTSQSEWRLGTFWRNGGGFNVTYASPLRVLSGPHESFHYTLTVTPDDRSQFSHHGGPNLGDVLMQGALVHFMAVLGRPPPANMTFTHMHGD